MIYEWVEAAPFTFSIVLKLFTNVLRGYHIKSVIEAIPSDYKLKQEQKQTIADRSFAASERSVYIIGIFSSLVAAFIATLRNNRLDLLLAVIIFFGIMGAIGILWLHSRNLDYFETRIYTIRRGWLITVLLVVIDLTLLLVTTAHSFIPAVPLRPEA